MASNIRAGGAFVEISAKMGPLDRALNQVQAKMRAFANNVQNIGSKLLGAGAGLGLPILAAGKAFADAGSEIYDMSQRTGASAEALSALKYAAEQSGASFQELGNGLRKMQQNLAEAQTGSDTAAKRFTDLGVSLQSLSDLSPDRQFQRIAEAISKVADPAQRTAAAMDLFGKGGAQLLPLMMEGAAGIEALKKQAEGLGLVFTTEAAASADALGDSLDMLKSAGRGVANTIGAAVAPTMKAMADVLTSASVRMSAFATGHRELIALGLKTATALSAAGGAMIGLSYGIRLVAPALKGISVGLALISSPVSLAVGGLAAVAAGLAYAGLAGDTLSQKMAGLGGKILPAVNAVTSGISTAWAATVDFLLPVWEGLKAAGATVFEALRAAIIPATQSTTEFLAAGWATIKSTVGPVLTWLRDAMIDAFAVGAFALTHFQQVATVALVGGALKVVQFGAEVGHIFTEVVPTYATYLYDNWKNIFTTLWNFTKTVTTNIWTNLKNFFSAVSSWLSGGDFSFEWTGLLQGFESTMRQLPAIAERTIGPLEQELQNELNASLGKMSEDYAGFRKRFDSKIGEGKGAAPAAEPAAAAAPKPPSPKPEFPDFASPAGPGGGAGAGPKYSVVGGFGFDTRMLPPDIGGGLAGGLAGAPGGAMAASAATSSPQAALQGILEQTKIIAKNTGGKKRDGMLSGFDGEII